MKNLEKTILTLSLAHIGLKYLGLWLEGFTGMFLVLFAGLIGLILLGLLVVCIVTIFKTRNKKLFSPLVLGIMAIFVFVFAPIEKLIEKLKSPVVLTGYCEHTVTAVSLKLREDNSFEFNTGAFLSQEIIHGIYHLNMDTLYLNLEEKHQGKIKNKLIFTEQGLLEIGDTIAHRHIFKITNNNLTRK